MNDLKYLILMQDDIFRNIELGSILIYPINKSDERQKGSSLKIKRRNGVAMATLLSRSARAKISVLRKNGLF